MRKYEVKRQELHGVCVLHCIAENAEAAIAACGGYCAFEVPGVYLIDSCWTHQPTVHHLHYAVNGVDVYARDSHMSETWDCQPYREPVRLTPDTPEIRQALIDACPKWKSLRDLIDGLPGYNHLYARRK